MTEKSNKEEKIKENESNSNLIFNEISKEDDSRISLKTAELDFDNEVYDEGDIASSLEMSFIAQALEAHKAKVAPETHPDFDGETCIECGDDIPEARLAMGRIRCVYCQEILEKKNKLRG